MTYVFKIIVLPLAILWRLWRRVSLVIVRGLFRQCGSRVILYPFDMFSYSTISLGSNVFIGKGAIFSASRSSITIGNSVMFGPRVTIMGGDHNISQIGRLMADVKEKRVCDDKPVIIEDDVWIGAGVIILKGVTVARGSVIAAGSVVTRSIPEFSIAGGIPCKVLKPRFGPEDLRRHKLMLGLRD